MVSYDSLSYGFTCVGHDGITPIASAHKALLVIAPDVDATCGALIGKKMPIESDFKLNSIALAGPLFAELDTMATPGIIACKSGRRARIVVAAWVCARKGGDVEDAVAYLKAVSKDFETSAPQREQWLRGAVAAHTVALASPLIFRQLFEKESSTYTYLLADPVSREAILIDPVVETAARDLAVLTNFVTADGHKGLHLVAGLNTHCHADHVTGTAALKRALPHVKSMIAEAAGSLADVLLQPYARVAFGARWIEVLPTPGHTDGCVSFVLDDRSMVFTGDALLIGGCGRTDFQQGSARTLYRSVREQLLTLPPECLVYPAHDYEGRPCSTVLGERLTNARLGDAKSEDEFVALMGALQLAHPKKIDLAVPANLICGFPSADEWVVAK
jgi:sulfur dioxygenase